MRESICPQCCQPSRRVHSYYIRQPLDLPINERAVRLRLHVRRFRCLNQACSTKTFAERLPSLVRPAAQHTVRATRLLQLLGLALGGEAGARFGQLLHLPTSPDTLLRAVRHLPSPKLPEPRVLGVDDWAFRRGHTYGTLLVDLERRRPIDLLDDRRAETFATWLQDHPGIEIISRDRSPEYARGARQGAPQARQVLDRWHVLKNLREALERFLVRRRRQLLLAAQNVDTEPAELPVEARATRRSTIDQAARQERRAQRLKYYEQVHSLHTQGMSTRKIARQLGIGRSTVIEYLRNEVFPERRQSPQRSMLDPYCVYLQKRWDEGCHNGVQLWHEIQALGYPGTRRLVSNWVVLRRERLLGQHSGLGRHPALPEQLKDAEAQAAATDTKTTLPPSGQLVWLLLREKSQLSGEELDLVTTLGRDTEFEQAYESAQSFCHLVAKRAAPELIQWLEDTMKSSIPELRNFAVGLQREEDAACAALELPYSNGQVEGQVTKLKLLKRQSYGRAKIDLLRQRMLHAI